MAYSRLKKQKAYFLPPDLIRRVRVQAAERNVNQSEFVEEALEDYLTRKSHDRRPEPISA